MKNKLPQIQSTKQKSTLGTIWQEKECDERLALAISQKFDLSPALAKTLAIKNIQLTDVENFLDPTIKNNLPNPFLLKDMDKAASKIISAVKNKQKITIFGDYDVDGATSSALLKRFILAIGGKAEIYIPDRILEGYGPNAKALVDLKNSGTDLVITVDCGTTAFAPLLAAKESGLEVIVIDHHLGALEKPEAIAVVNPNRLDENFEHKNLAAVGVCFLLAVGVNKLLREENFYQQNNLSEPQLLGLLDLVALGTVCDVVALSGINRAFVNQGLKVIRSRSNLGIRNLCDLASLSEPCSAYHLGFVIGPRINAGGRVGKSDLGARLLSSNDEFESKKIAADLDIFNKQRKDIEVGVLEEALKQVQKQKNKILGGHSPSGGVSGRSSASEDGAMGVNIPPLGELAVGRARARTEQWGIKESVIFASSTNWHQGVIGIVAARVKEKYNKPTAIISISNGIGKASCRSISGVDFGSAIIKARTSGLILEGGGHAMAAGFSVAENKIAELHEFLNQELEADVAKNHLENVSYFHGTLDINSANLNLAQEISKLEPFGAGNSRPKFLIKDLLIIEANLIGKEKNHVRCVFGSKNITGWQGRLNSVCFKAMESKVGEILISKNKGNPINIIGTLNINYWLGDENLQIMIEDILP